MEYIDLRQEVDRLVLAEEPAKAGIIEAIIELWPESQGYISRWGDMRFCCEVANKEVNQLELEHQAIEHDDSPLEVYPFVSIGPHDRLYSFPPCFVVADAPHGGFGEIPREGWQEEMIEAGISPLVILKVEAYLEQHQPVLYMETDDG